MSSFNSRLNAVLFLMLAVSAQAAAMTVYDVIQLSKKSYSDQDIIALIETTGSAFELKADDIPRLVKLGVSEPVIQVMLSAVPAEPPVESSPDAAPEQFATIPLDIKSDKLVPRAVIDSEPLTEPGSGRHHHQAINFSGIRLFVLRDEGGYPSVAARARMVADRLRAASALDGQFRPAHVAGNDTVMFTVTGTSQTVMVISISAQDASAYQRRSGRRVTPNLLASYWSDLLTDYWSIALSGQPPDRLSMLHEGEALQELYKSLDTSIDNEADRLTGAFQSLPKQEQDHLLQLAVSVPRNFNTTDVHTGEAP
ncbi:MAG TPA: hypothetical protein ENI62_15005 [Gammaproteobacteria bacterium]|nr:hypothetical protein [Gammaproteobacteria bacterium]